MTLRRYESSELDELALRLLDYCAIVRRMANRCDEEGLEDFRLNDKKAMEWLDRFDIWVRRAADDLEVQILKNRGALLARELSAAEKKSENRVNKKQSKKKS